MDVATVSAYVTAVAAGVAPGGTKVGAGLIGRGAGWGRGESSGGGGSFKKKKEKMSDLALVVPGLSDDIFLRTDYSLTHLSDSLTDIHSVLAGYSDGSSCSSMPHSSIAVYS